MKVHADTGRLLSAFLIVLGTCTMAVGESPLVTEEIPSPFQAGATTVTILPPDHVEPGKHYSVLYLLPVEPGTEARYGSAMAEAVKHDLANTYQIFCVAPTFSAMPWYANHPTDETRQQERHFIETVIPWVEGRFPVEASRQGRLLLGFSKSGFGALSLLLRHSALFDKAVAWDAPLDKFQPDQFNMLDIFGSDENFQRYAIAPLLATHGGELQGQAARIFLMRKRGGDHPMEATRDAFVAGAIPHSFAYTDSIPHRWDSGWFLNAAKRVLPPQA